jgi:hypothetical protein
VQNGRRGPLRVPLADRPCAGKPRQASMAGVRLLAPYVQSGMTVLEQLARQYLCPLNIARPRPGSAICPRCREQTSLPARSLRPA